MLDPQLPSKTISPNSDDIDAVAYSEWVGTTNVYHFDGILSSMPIQSVKVAPCELRLAVSTNVIPVEVGMAVSHESLVVGSSHVTSR